MGLLLTACELTCLVYVTVENGLQTLHCTRMGSRNMWFGGCMSCKNKNDQTVMRQGINHGKM